MRRLVLSNLVVLGIGLAGMYASGLLTDDDPRSIAPSLQALSPLAVNSSWSEKNASDRANNRNTPRSLKTPTGVPASLRCDEARKIINQARQLLASPPARVEPKHFAEALIDWLDPHGLWSASPDSPVSANLRRRARDLLQDIEHEPGPPCVAAQEVGESLALWVNELRTISKRAQQNASATSVDDAAKLAFAPLFEEGTVTRPAKELAAELGKRLGIIEKSLGAGAVDSIDVAFSRAFPEDEVVWADVILGAAVRAYIPQIDPHGGWAPYEEETSLYEVDLEANPPPRLWRKMTRTALGVRIEESTHASLNKGDLVLAVGDVPTACLGVEQAEQLSILDAEPGSSVSQSVLVLPKGETVPRRVNVSFQAESSAPAVDEPEVTAIDETAAALPMRGGFEAKRLRFSDSEVLVIPIGDVPDDLGAELATTLSRARVEAPFTGVILDLRGNGGGSTDGAAAAIGLFLPGAQLFPLRRRDGSIEVDRAAVPPVLDRWTGPLATMVDGDTASAAEMIAGALGVYRRAPIVGTRTFGKGCAQEYLEDDARVGVLRLTTLVYALPDGSPVQRTGISPWISLPIPKSREREAMLLRAQPPWSGPDVRTENLIREVPWPKHGGAIGPCQDQQLCAALRALGGSKSAQR